MVRNYSAIKNYGLWKKLWLMEIFTKRTWSLKASCRTTCTFQFCNSTYVCLCNWRRLTGNTPKCRVIPSKKAFHLSSTAAHLIRQPRLINSPSNTYPEFCLFLSIPVTLPSSKPAASFILNIEVPRWTPPHLLPSSSPISTQSAEWSVFHVN